MNCVCCTQTSICNRIVFMHVNTNQYNPGHATITNTKNEAPGFYNAIVNNQTPKRLFGMRYSGTK